MVTTTHYKFKGSEKRLITADFTFKKSQDAVPIVLFCHGFKGFKDWGGWHLVAQYFALHNFPFFKFNFSHNGTTPSELRDINDLEAFGNNNLSKELNDVSLVLDFIVSKKESMEIEWNEEFIIIGHSRGGGIALLAAQADSRIKQCITWNSVYTFDKHVNLQDPKIWEEKGVHWIENKRTKLKMPIYYQFYKDFQMHQATLNIPSSLQEFDKPLLAVHAENDEAVSPEDSRKIADAVNHALLVLIDDTGHTFGIHHPLESDVLPDAMKMVLEETIEFLTL